MENIERISLFIAIQECESVDDVQIIRKEIERRFECNIITYQIYNILNQYLFKKQCTLERNVKNAIS